MRLNEVATWLENVVSEPGAPPMFRVPTPAVQLARDQKRYSDPDMRVSRRSDSGVLEIRFEKNESRRVIDPALTAISIAHEEDPERKFLELRRDREGSQFQVSRTSIESLPVLGPGGRVIIRDSDAVFMADITVRSRDFKGVASEGWNDPGLVYQALTNEFGDYGRHLEMKPRLGYFELSKYDVQSLIRPVFMFLIQVRHKSPRGTYVAWETTRVLPATINESIAEREGLGVSE